MGYYPDPALSALNAYRYDKRNVVQRGTLAYLTNWNAEFAWRNHSAHRRFYEGAEAQANQLGFRLEHIWFGDPQFRQERINSILLSRGIHGLIFASWLPQNDCNPGFDWDQFCYIKIDYFPSQVPMNYITNDQQSIIQTAYQKLWEKGFRRIGLVMPKGWDDLAMKAWSVGYLLAKENVGCFADVPVLCYDTDKAIGSPDDEIRVDPLALKQWMQVHRPDAILSFRPLY